MSKPTDTELKTAMTAAASMKEQNKDPFFVAKSLLNHNYRLRFYEDLLKHADLYMNHGQAEHDHMELLRSIEKVKEAENFIEHNSPDGFGLE